MLAKVTYKALFPVEIFDKKIIPKKGAERNKFLII